MTAIPADATDVAARWRSLSDAELGVADALLTDAWAVLQTLAPSLGASLDAGSMDPSVVTSILCASVLRVLRNPEGNKSESIDDYSWTRDSAVSAGALYFTDLELELVRGVMPRAASIAYPDTLGC